METMFELARLASCLLTSIVMSGVIHWLYERSDARREVRRLKAENARLRAWIEEQARVPELGPHRTSCDAVDAQRGALRALQAGGPVLRVVHGGVQHAAKDVRPEPPPPTAVPGPGRTCEE